MSRVCDRSIGEASSTLGASSLKNFSAVSGCHSLSEAMFLFSLSLLRLICSLHDSTSFNFFKRQKTRFPRLSLRIHTKASYIITEKSQFVNRNLKFIFKTIYLYNTRAHETQKSRKRVKRRKLEKRLDGD